MTFQSRRFHSLALSALLIGSLTAPMAALAQNTSAGEPPAMPAKTGKHHRWNAEHKAAHQQFMKDLNLSEQQKEQLKAAKEKFHRENAGLYENMKAKRAELKALGSDPANKAKREQLKAELKQERQALMAKKKASMQGILTPEQQAKWDAKKAERKARWQEKHMNRQSQPQQVQ